MMPTWPTIPTWSDPTEINKGNRYNARDGVTAADLNLIITNLMYLKEYGGLSEYSWLGEYVEGVSYRAGAIVRYQGDIYLCIQDLDDQQDPTDTAYWQMLNTEIPEIGASIALNSIAEEEGSLTVAYALAEKAVLPAATNKQLGVLLDANFIKSNIKSGESIFGLVGTYAGEAPEIYDGTINIESGYTTISGSYIIDADKAYAALSALPASKTYTVEFSAGSAMNGEQEKKGFISMTFNVDGDKSIIYGRADGSVTAFSSTEHMTGGNGFAPYYNAYEEGNGAMVNFYEGTECRKEFKEMFLSIADEYSAAQRQITVYSSGTPYTFNVPDGVDDWEGMNNVYSNENSYTYIASTSNGRMSLVIETHGTEMGGDGDIYYNQNQYNSVYSSDSLDVGTYYWTTPQHSGGSGN